MPSTPLPADFFDRTPVTLAQALLGKILRHRVDSDAHGPIWLSARIIEAEAYYRREKGSHSSQGKTPSRAAMFDPPATIYMYYARGGDSLNFSARGDGNAVLVKSAWPITDDVSPDVAIAVMQALNPGTRGPRPVESLCRGQTLTCRSLGLEVAEWNRSQLDPDRFRADDDGYHPTEVIECRRLGIPAGRDEHLPYRFVDARFARYCTSNPLTKRGWKEGVDYRRIRTLRSASG